LRQFAFNKVIHINQLRIRIITKNTIFPQYQFAEQYNSLVPGTVSSIAIAGLAVVLVSLLFIPEPQAALWVSFSIVSINLGILGLMPFFALRLDFISMVSFNWAHFLNVNFAILGHNCYGQFDSIIHKRIKVIQYYFPQIRALASASIFAPIWPIHLLEVREIPWKECEMPFMLLARCHPILFDIFILSIKPIIQSASSTILGVSFLASTESYICKEF